MNTNLQIIPTSEKIKVQDYPYGFKLRTTLYDSIEFNPSKGYRHVTETINPKTGRNNKPKKSTYYEFLFRYYDDKNHIQTVHPRLYSDEDTNKTMEFLAKNFEILTPQEISYAYIKIISWTKCNLKSKVLYAGAVLEKLLVVYDPIMLKLVEGLKSGNNTLTGLSIDVQAVEALEDPNYNPFQVTERFTIGADGIKQSPVN
jgi:hypothetical protein